MNSIFFLIAKNFNPLLEIPESEIETRRRPLLDDKLQNILGAGASNLYGIPHGDHFRELQPIIQNNL